MAKELENQQEEQEETLQDIHDADEDEADELDAAEDLEDTEEDSEETEAGEEDGEASLTDDTPVPFVFTNDEGVEEEFDITYGDLKETIINYQKLSEEHNTLATELAPLVNEMQNSPLMANIYKYRQHGWNDAQILQEIYKGISANQGQVQQETSMDDNFYADKNAFNKAVKEQVDALLNPVLQQQQTAINAQQKQQRISYNSNNLNQALEAAGWDSKANSPVMVNKLSKTFQTLWGNIDFNSMDLSSDKAKVLVSMALGQNAAKVKNKAGQMISQAKVPSTLKANSVKMVKSPESVRVGTYQDRQRATAELFKIKK